MVQLYNTGAYYVDGILIPDDSGATAALAACGKTLTKEQASKNTLAYSILSAHNTSGNMDQLKIKFDAMASHDITYVGIVQTARASGLEKFPIPYVLTNCHNSLCAVGGTINEDDHLFGLSAAKKYGGIYVPAHQAVIHQYMREMMSGCGKMILGSDSHTRYGALGTMAIGEGGPELVKQLLCKTYDVACPQVVAVRLTGKPVAGVGPQDVALAIIGAVFKNGYVKNKVMEFIGDGIANLNVEYRNGIDVMTTETTCLTSIWETDAQVADYYKLHGRAGDFKELRVQDAYYDGVVDIDLSSIRPMIAMPFHPSNVFEIETLNKNLMDILAQVEKEGASQLDNPNIRFTLRDKVKNGRLMVDQGVIAGCAGGTYDNVCDATDILAGHSIGADDFSLSVYPSSQPVMMALTENGAIAKLMQTGATIRTAFCGPCFGAGDVPANGGLSIRHSTRNFPNREGSKPSGGQVASVALMDARSIAATARNGGILTAATEVDCTFSKPQYFFHKEIYENRVYDGCGKAQTDFELRFGPNIADWPQMSPLTEHLVLDVAAFITDPVTTTDELIPSGETSSYRSNPHKLAEFTLSRKDPAYVEAAKRIYAFEQKRLAGEPAFEHGNPHCPIDAICAIPGFEKVDETTIGIGTLIYAVKPGDGSAREQAASCQKVLGGWANIAQEYATKRYRSNLINWGMLPFLLDGEPVFAKYDSIFIPNIRAAVQEKREKIAAYALCKSGTKEMTLSLGALTDDEREIILAGCLINFYRAQN